MSDVSSEDIQSGITRREFLTSTAGALGATALYPLLSPPKKLFAQSENPIKVGVLLPLSGAPAVTGETALEGMELFFEQVGYRAGGRSIELFVEDSEFDPGVGISRARRLIENEQVDLLAGVNSSGVLMALRDYVEANQTLLLVGGAAGANGLSRDMTSPMIWRTTFTNWQPNWAMGTWAYENVGERAVVTGLDYAAGYENTAAFAHSFVEAGGEIVDSIAAPFPEMGDVSPMMSTISSIEPDLVYSFYPGSWAVRFVNAYDEFGLSEEIPLLGAGFLAGEAVLPAQGESSLGVRTGLHWGYLLDNPTNVEFRNEYEQMHDRRPAVYSVHGYDTARLIAEVAERLGGDLGDTDAIIDVLPEISFDSPRGRFTLDEETQNPEQHIYVREAIENDGVYTNDVLEDLGVHPDPGDNSRDRQVIG